MITYLFQHVLFHEYEIDDFVRDASVCSGNHELYHLCNSTSFDLSNHLLVASIYGHAEMISFYNIKWSGNCFDWHILFIIFSNNTPLHAAALYGHLSILKLLIRKGANINQKNGDGMTPLYSAFQSGHLHIVKF